MQLVTRRSNLVARSVRSLLIAAGVAAAITAGGVSASAANVGTAFSYQGRLLDAGAPANGTYDIQVLLFDAAAAGAQVGATQTLNDVVVSNGVFSASVDFGAQMNGSARWVELRVRPGNSVGAYTPILPRTALEATPYAQGLRLPVSETAAAGGTMLSFTNTSASGSVMGLTSVGASGNYPFGFFQPVLWADTSDGNGMFSLTSAAGAYAIYAVSSGSGGRAVVARNTGALGQVSTMNITDAANTSNALEVQTVGTGRAGWFNNTNSAATLPTLYAKNIATGDSIPNGSQENGIAIKGESTGGFGIGVMGKGVNAGVFGYSGTTGAAGVWGTTDGGGGSISTGVRGDGNGAGTSGVAGFNNFGNAIYGQSSGGSGKAGFFSGDVLITGSLQVNGAKNFKIDHPLDPANKYLVHAAVESSEMKNIYDGIAVISPDGTATVTLPSYFGALNVEYRYQLTCIGANAPVYIAEEISKNQFKIAGGKPGMKVSWQVTGVRNDAAAVSNPIKVELDKVGSEVGKYINPEAFGQPITKSVDSMAGAKVPAVN
ncbi:MAG: hypothetical protein K2Y21_05730 [Phycisphaerales bacterium]|nr:hypothetical protein [Phycisphaerales bacterium]